MRSKSAKAIWLNGKKVWFEMRDQEGYESDAPFDEADIVGEYPEDYHPHFNKWQQIVGVRT